MAHQILRTIEIARRRGVSKSKVYEDIRNGLWPRLIPLGPRLRGQLETEVDELIGARVAGQTDDEIRLLVQRLTAARKTVAQPGRHA